jgi:hypothetical protein
MRHLSMPNVSSTGLVVRVKTRAFSELQSYYLFADYK